MNQSITTQQRVERVIVRRIIHDALRAGYALNVFNDDGYDYELPEPSTKTKSILDAMFATDEEWLWFFRDNKRVGWVFFVYGNSGWYVISDYSTNLESVLEGANKLVNRFSL